MSSNVTPLRREGGPLTKSQRDLVKGVRGVAEQVVYALGFALGGDPHSQDRVQAAHLGIVNAARKYDSELGPFLPWAKLGAVSEVLTTERRERKQRRLATAGRIVGFRVGATRQHRDGDIPLDASDEALFGALVGIVEEQIVGEWLGALAASQESPEGDDDVAEVQEWDTVMAATMRELEKLEPSNRELLLLFAHGHDIKAQAQKRNVDYSTLLDQFHKQLGLLRARLKGKNVTAAPPRPMAAPSVLPDREPAPPRKKGKPDKGSPDD